MVQNLYMLFYCGLKIFHCAYPVLLSVLFWQTFDLLGLISCTCRVINPIVRLQVSLLVDVYTYLVLFFLFFCFYCWVFLYSLNNQSEPAKITQSQPKSPRASQNHPELAKITQSQPKSSRASQNHPELAKIIQSQPKSSRASQNHPEPAKIIQS